MCVRRVAGAALGLAVVVAGGCRGGNFANENDELRRRVVELETENDDLRRRSDELEASLRRETAPRESVALGTDAATQVPLVTRLEIDKRSHVDDTTGDGTPDVLRLYVTSRDGRDRFVQLAGAISVNVARLPAGAPAETITQTNVDATTLRNAYRSSFMGTHYTIEIPLPTGRVSEMGGELDVRVHYTDVRTGGTLDAHRAVALR